MGIYTIPVTYSIWFVGLFNRFTKLKYFLAQSWTIPWMWAARSKVTLIKNFDYKINQFSFTRTETQIKKIIEHSEKNKNSMKK